MLAKIVEEGSAASAARLAQKHSGIIIMRFNGRLGTAQALTYGCRTWNYFTWLGYGARADALGAGEAAHRRRERRGSCERARARRGGERAGGGAGRHTCTCTCT